MHYISTLSIQRGHLKLCPSVYSPLSPAYTISHYNFLGGGQRPKGAGRRCEGAPAHRAGAAIPSSH